MTESMKQQLRTAWLARGISVPEHIWERAHSWMVERPVHEAYHGRDGDLYWTYTEPMGVTIYALYDFAGRQIFQEGKGHEG